MSDRNFAGTGAAPASASGGVLVACPKTQHSYQAVLALQERSALTRYITGYYYKKRSLAASVVAAIPARFASRLERELQRRRLDFLEDSLIETVSATELLCSLADRNPRLRPWSKRLDLWGFHLRRYQERVARRILALRPKVVLCYDTCSLRIFEAAHKIGALCVLDQTTGHLTHYVEVMRGAGLEPDLPDELLGIAKAEVQSADIVLAPSQYVADTLLQIGVKNERIITIPYGVDLERFRDIRTDRPRGSDGVRGLYVGRLSAQKGVPDVLRAVEMIADPNFELRLVGQLLGPSDWIRPRPGVTYHLPLPQHEINRAYREADFFVQASLHEGSSLSILEALACGLPVITTPNAGSVVRDGIEGFIVPPRDVKAISERMKELIDNPELRLAMGRRARERAQSFSWAGYRERVGALLCELARTPADCHATVIDSHRLRNARVLDVVNDAVDPNERRASGTHVN